MKSSQELRKQQEELQKRLDKIKREAKKAEKLEQAEAERQKQEVRIAFAFRFVEEAKRVSLQNGETFFDYVCRTAGISEPKDESAEQNSSEAETGADGQPDQAGGEK